MIKLISFSSYKEFVYYLCRYKDKFFVSRVKEDKAFGHYVDNDKLPIRVIDLDEIYEISSR
jgi:hypothetical protein